jgi:hypothetical protein
MGSLNDIYYSKQNDPSAYGSPSRSVMTHMTFEVLI